MTSALDYEILDLRHYSATHLRPVLDQESLVWRERLHWDFRASADLMLQYLDSHILPGYVTVDRSGVSGFVFCVYEESKAVIGDVFAVSRTSDEPAAEVESRLLEFLIELLQNSPGVDRIESQLLLHPHGSHEAVFERNGFTTHPRLFMELELRNGGLRCAPRPGISPSPELEMRRWRESDFAAAGRLIASAYERHLDSRINDQYRSVAGSLRFLHNIVRFPGCGTFDPAASFVITGPGFENMVAMLLCSRVRDDVGHVTQICVADRYRGQGLATQMLHACANDLRSRGVGELTLTVTEANAVAVSLYRNCGFREKHSFDAMVWERAAGRPL